ARAGVAGARHGTGRSVADGRGQLVPASQQARHRHPLTGRRPIVDHTRDAQAPEPLILSAYRSILNDGLWPYTLARKDPRRQPMAGMRSDAAVPSHRPHGLARVTGRRRWVIPAALGATAIVGAGVLVVAFNASGAATARKCSGPTQNFTVVTSAQVFPTVEGLARKWNATGPTVGGHCAAATVVRKESSEVA